MAITLRLCGEDKVFDFDTLTAMDVVEGTPLLDGPDWEETDPEVMDAPELLTVPPCMAMQFGAWRDQKQRQVHFSPYCPRKPASALRLSMSFFDIPEHSVCRHEVCMRTYVWVPRWLFLVLAGGAAYTRADKQ